MINLTSEIDIGRLYTAQDGSRDALRPFRRNRQEMLREFVGSYYNDNGARYEVLVNLLALTADTYTIGLSANRPRVKVSVSQDAGMPQQLWPFAFRYQVNLNNLIKEMRMVTTNQLIVLDALFSIGIGKVYLADSPIQLADDEWADPGRPYFGRISIDNFVMDVSPGDVRRCKFMSDEYRVSWDACRTHPGFDKSVLKLLSPTSKHDRGEEQAADIAAGSLVDGDEYEPMIDLMDVWLPEIQSIAVFPRHRQTKPLLVEKWDGPEGGPYDLLTFADVPDNVMPSSPLQNLFGLHLLYNGLIRKQARQAKRQKTNPAFRPENQDDAKRLQRASDGEWVNVRDPSTINVISQGGASPENQAFSLGVLELFDRQAGNLAAQAGLGPQAETASQENLIHQAVSRKEAKMQGRFLEFESRVAGKLGHMMWADEVLQLNSVAEVRPGSKIYVDVPWTPELREGNHWQYNFEVEPYSMNYVSPEAKLMKMERAMDRLGQYYPILQQAGGTIDMRRMVRDYAAMLDVPELENWITFATGPWMQPAEMGGAMQMPGNTTRNYVRRNVATGGTPQARNLAMQQALLKSSGSGRGG